WLARKSCRVSESRANSPKRRTTATHYRQNSAYGLHAAEPVRLLGTAEDVWVVLASPNCDCRLVLLIQRRLLRRPGFGLVVWVTFKWQLLGERHQFPVSLRRRTHDRPLRPLEAVDREQVGLTGPYDLLALLD